MRVFCFVCLLWAGMALAQTSSPQAGSPGTTPAPASPQQPGSSPAAPAQATPAPTPIPSARPNPQSRPAGEKEEGKEPAATSTTPAEVPPTAAVITITGVCPEKPPSAKAGTAAKSGTTTKSASATAGAAKEDCRTVITRAQFEKLADSLDPNMPASVRRQLANAYPRMLSLAREAQKRGLDKTPGFREKMQFARLSVLSQELQQSIQKEAAQISQTDMQDYYNKNKAAFEEASLQRIVVPKTKLADPNLKGEEAKQQQQANEEAMSKEAEALHARAVAREDFEKLQKEAYDFAKFTSAPPSVSMTKVRRSTLPPNQGSVMDLKAGEVSPLINEGNGHYIYKMVSKEVLPIDQVKDEIHGTLQSQRMKDLTNGLQAGWSAQLNEAYFGPTPAAPAGPSGPAGGSRPRMVTPRRPPTTTSPSQPN